MGTYTNLKLEITLKKETPKVVIDLLRRIIIEGDLGIDDNSHIPHPKIIPT